jgi:hypothetical protein
MGGMDWVKGKAGIMRVILEREVSNLKIDDLGGRSNGSEVEEERRIRGIIQPVAPQCMIEKNVKHSFLKGLGD